MSETHPHLPLFPLPIVACPGDLVPLHIFEQRYRDMMAYCLDEARSESERQFVICLARDEAMESTGCAMRIGEVVQTYDDGRLDILARAMHRVAVRETSAEGSYSTVAVDVVADDEASVDPELEQEVVKLAITYLGLAQGPSYIPAVAGQQLTSYRVAHETIEDVVIRQHLLEQTREAERLTYLQRYFCKAIPRLRKLEQINSQVKTNGHFKGFPGVEE